MNVAAADTKTVVERFERTDSMLVQIADAVRRRKRPTDDDNEPIATSTIGGVLISGYVRASLQKIQEIAGRITKGPVKAVPVMLD